MSCYKESEASKAASALILMLLGIPALIVISSILNGFFLSKMWQWFIMSKFDLPSLRIPEAIGIGMIISYLTYHDYAKKKEDSQLNYLFAMVFIRPFCMLFTGWIVTLFL